MIVVDAYGHEHTVPNQWDQDFEIVLPFLGNWDNERMHWHVKSKKKIAQKTAVRLQCQALGRAPRLPCTVVLQRISRGTMDDDNVPGTMKYVRDEIARWMGLNSDRKPGLAWRYGQQKTKRPKHLAVRVTIYNGETKR